MGAAVIIPFPVPPSVREELLEDLEVIALWNARDAIAAALQEVHAHDRNAFDGFVRVTRSILRIVRGDGDAV